MENWKNVRSLFKVWHFFNVVYNSFITLNLLFYLGDFGERGTTSEKNKAFSSNMGDATWNDVHKTK